jgi:hypothetical protein
MSTKELPEELVRMVKLGSSIYFHQEDICRILEIIQSGCESINARVKIKHAIEVFSCTVDPLSSNDEE